MKTSAYSIKDYYCPVCNNIESHGTNHFGEIYSRCKNCDNSVLYCKSAERPEPDETFVFLTYRFNMEYKPERELYETLKEQMKNFGYEKFNVWGTHEHSVALQNHHGRHIGIFSPEKFESQYVSTIGRVHNWFEFIFPNKNIKTGYYLIKK